MKEGSFDMNRGFAVLMACALILLNASYSYAVPMRGSMTIWSVHALEMTGLGVRRTNSRIITSMQSLEMTRSDSVAGGWLVWSAQALEMTGLGVVAAGGRIITSAQSLEMTGL